MEIASGRAVSSLVTGDVPEDWRVANIIPLFKKRSRVNPRDYKLVCFTSMVGNIFEQILLHLEEGRIIRDGKYGLVWCRPCLTSLIELFQEVTKVIEEVG